MNRRLFLCLLLSVMTTVSYAAEDNKHFNFIAMADIHFDPFTSCGISKPCILIEKLRSSPVEQWPQLFSRYDTKPPHFREDTNYRLLISALTAAKQVAARHHAQFVLYLGDMMGHESRRKYKRYTSDKTGAQYPLFARKILEFTTRELASAFPSMNVYMIVGNNDSYHGDYYIKPHGEFFSDAGRWWSGLIKNQDIQASMQRQFSNVGYYSIEFPYPANLKLIALNTSLFSGKAKGKNIESVALQEINWLHAQLQQARQAHQHVFIAIHIPPGVDLYATKRVRLFRLFSLWKTTFSNRFDAELNEFSPEIAGVFAGHLHRNWYQMIGAKHEIPLIGVTSISPIFGNQPGFKNISYYLDPIHLDDFSTYSFPLHGGMIWAIRKETISKSSIILAA